MDVVNISSIQQGSFDSTFDDDFVLRIKSPKMDESESDTGIQTFSFEGTEGKGLDGPDHPKLVQIGSVKLNASSDGEEDRFSVRILGYKVNNSKMSTIWNTVNALKQIKNYQIQPWKLTGPKLDGFNTAGTLRHVTKASLKSLEYAVHLGLR